MDPEFLSWSKIIWLAFIIFVGVLIIVGNFIVLCALGIQKSLRTPSNIYLGSLAAIDFSVGVFILPLRITEIYFQEWTFSETLCSIYLILDVNLCTLSIYHLIAIAWDRYQTVTQGIRYMQRRSFTTVAITIGFLWIASLWISTPPALGWNKHDWGLQIRSNRTQCVLTRSKGYVFHSSLGTFFLPTVFLLFLYFKIYLRLKEKLRSKSRPASMNVFGGLDKSGVAGESSDTFSSEDVLEAIPKSQKSETLQKRIKFRLSKIRCSILRNSSVPQDQEQELQNVETAEPVAVTENDTPSSASSASTQSGTGTGSKSILRQFSKLPNPQQRTQFQEFVQKKIKFSLTKERRAARTLGVIIGAFLICWIPFCILYVTDAFFYPLVDTIWFEITQWMGYFNSFMNPLIYSIFQKDFRAAFVKIVFFYKSNGGRKC